jgi:hypothetical protein
VGVTGWAGQCTARRHISGVGTGRDVQAVAVAARTRVEAQRRAMRTQLLGGERRGNSVEGARRGRTAAEQRAAGTEAGGGSSDMVVDSVRRTGWSSCSCA